MAQGNWRLHKATSTTSSLQTSSRQGASFRNTELCDCVLGQRLCFCPSPKNPTSTWCVCKRHRTDPANMDMQRLCTELCLLLFTMSRRRCHHHHHSRLVSCPVSACWFLWLFSFTVNSTHPATPPWRGHCICPAICRYCKMMNDFRGGGGCMMQFWPRDLLTRMGDGVEEGGLMIVLLKTNKAWNVCFCFLHQICLVCRHADVLMFGKNCDYFFLYCY